MYLISCFVPLEVHVALMICCFAFGNFNWLVMERIPEARMIELLLQKSSLHATTDVRYAFVSRTLKYKLQKKPKSSHKKK